MRFAWNSFVTGPALGILWAFIVATTLSVALSFMTGAPFRPGLFGGILLGSLAGLAAIETRSCRPDWPGGGSRPEPSRSDSNVSPSTVRWYWILSPAKARPTWPNRLSFVASYTISSLHERPAAVNSTVSTSPPNRSVGLVLR